MAEEKRGIEETKDVLAFVFSFITAVKKSYEDDNFNWRDALHFVDPLNKLGEAVKNVDEVLPEMEDLDEEEWEELIEYAKSEFNIADENAEYALDVALEVGKGVLNLVSTVRS